jgi:hypothetical protein
VERGIKKRSCIGCGDGGGSRSCLACLFAHSLTHLCVCGIGVSQAGLRPKEGFMMAVNAPDVVRLMRDPYYVCVCVCSHAYPPTVVGTSYGWFVYAYGNAAFFSHPTRTYEVSACVLSGPTVFLICHLRLRPLPHK